MEVTARIKISGTTVTSGGMLGAFAGGECRGVKDAGATGPGGYVFIIFIYSNSPAGETISFKFYDTASDKVFGITDTISFIPDAQLGNAVSPRIFNCITENSPALSVTPDSRALAFTQGSKTFSVSNSGGGSMNWAATVSTGEDWAHITSGAIGSNSGNITVTVDANSGNVQRTSNIMITANDAAGSPKNVTVRQGFRSGNNNVYVIESILPPVLKADAGVDKGIALGDSVRLGGTIAGNDGYGKYLFLWSPPAGLSDPTSPNPWAKPRGKSVYTLMVVDMHNCKAMDEVLVAVSGTGIFNEDLTVSALVYPNPAHSKVNISIEGFVEKGNLSIVNILGQKVYQEEIRFVDNLKHEIDVSRWQNGLYQLVIQTDYKVITKAILIF